MKNKDYQRCPLGREAAAYLRDKGPDLTEASKRDYEACLDKLARHFPDKELADFEIEAGGRRLVKDWLDHLWGARSPRTWNKNLSISRDFFRWAIDEERMKTDPTRPIRAKRRRDVHRETYAEDVCTAIIANAGDVRDRIALRLLLQYGLRKGTLAVVRFQHFDHQRRWLTVFAKGGKIRNLPIPDPHFWLDLERLILDVAAAPEHFLMARQKAIPVGSPVKGRRATAMRRFPEKPMGEHGLHDWWYRQLERAGVVTKGTTSGFKMHRARHTAGQRLLDETNDLKAVQRLLMHSSIQTTGDIYVDRDNEQLAHLLARTLGVDDVSSDE